MGIQDYTDQALGFAKKINPFGSGSAAPNPATPPSGASMGSRATIMSGGPQAPNWSTSPGAAPGSTPNPSQWTTSPGANPSGASMGSRATMMSGGPQAPNWSTSPGAMAGEAEATAATSSSRAALLRNGLSSLNRLGNMPVSQVVSDLAPAAKTAAKLAARGQAGVSVARGLWDGMTRPQDEFERQTGLDSGSLPSMIAARGLGALQNIGNYATSGIADRVGNALSGNGFGHSDSYNSSAVVDTPVSIHDGIKPLTPPTAPTPAPVAPTAPTAQETSNATMGLPVDAQRGAASMSLRDAMKQQSMSGMTGQKPQPYNVGKDINGGLSSGNIYASASQPGGKLDTFTGTGDGSANTAYEKSDQYQQGLQVAQKNRDLLAQYQADNAKPAPGSGVVSFGSPPDIMSGMTGWRANAQSHGDKSRAIQQAGIDAQREASMASTVSSPSTPCKALFESALNTSLFGIGLSDRDTS